MSLCVGVCVHVNACVHPHTHTHTCMDINPRCVSASQENISQSKSEGQLFIRSAGSLFGCQGSRLPWGERRGRSKVYSVMGDGGVEVCQLVHQSALCGAGFFPYESLCFQQPLKNKWDTEVE